MTATLATNTGPTPERERERGRWVDRRFLAEGEFEREGGRLAGR